MMNKQQFLAAVRLNAVNVPSEELAALLDYYTEMIDEAMDEGLTEEEAVARLGSWEEICEQIQTCRAETPLVSPPISEPIGAAEQKTNTDKNEDTADTWIAKAKKWKSISLPAWAVVLLILTSPVWGAVVLALGIAVFAVVASLVITGGALVISLFAVVAALAVVGIVGIPAAFLMLFTGDTAPFLLTLGCGLVCIGLSIFAALLLFPFTSFFVSSVKRLFSWIVGLFR